MQAEINRVGIKPPVNVITIYTDGACIGNPGPGGWAAVLISPGKKNREMSGGEPHTTNNRMELAAALMALRSLDDTQEAIIYTDSQYLQKGISEWLAGWEKRAWKTTGRSAVKNQDLWQALAIEIKRRSVTWKWLEGHKGTPGNERANALAQTAARHQQRKHS